MAGSSLAAYLNPSRAGSLLTTCVKRAKSTHSHHIRHSTVPLQRLLLSLPSLFSRLPSGCLALNSWQLLTFAHLLKLSEGPRLWGDHAILLRQAGFDPSLQPRGSLIVLPHFLSRAWVCISTRTATATGQGPYHSSHHVCLRRPVCRIFSALWCGERQVWTLWAHSSGCAAVSTTLALCGPGYVSGPL